MSVSGGGKPSDENVVQLIPRETSKMFGKVVTGGSAAEGDVHNGNTPDEYGMTDQDWIDILIDSPGG